MVGGEFLAAYCLCTRFRLVGHFSSFCHSASAASFSIPLAYVVFFPFFNISLVSHLPYVLNKNSPDTKYKLATIMKL